MTSDATNQCSAGGLNPLPPTQCLSAPPTRLNPTQPLTQPDLNLLPPPTTTTASTPGSFKVGCLGLEEPSDPTPSEGPPHMHCNFSLCDHARRNPALHADPSPPSRWGERRPLPVGEPPPPAAQELLLKLALCWVSWKPPLASQLLLSLSPRPGGGRKALVSTDFPHCQRPSAEAPAGARVGRNISFKGQADVSGKPFPEERAHVCVGGGPHPPSRPAHPISGP